MPKLEDFYLKPNLRFFSEEERRELGRKWGELMEQGHEEEAKKLALQFPISPDLLQSAKEDRGIESLISSGLNLSRAVEKYGKEWLEH